MNARRDEPPASSAELRERVLEALRDLLATRTFDSLSVAEIIAAAGVSRASFYFYFPGKQAALAELVRRAVGAGHEAAQPWIESATPGATPGGTSGVTSGGTSGAASGAASDAASGAASDAASGDRLGGAVVRPGGALGPREALRHGIDAGAGLWLANAGVLRAIVESWGSDPQLREVWLAQMATFTSATIARIEADPEAMRRLAAVDVPALAASLTWLGERLYYLAACGVPPFADRRVLVDTLTHLWISALYDNDQARLGPGWN